MLFLGRGAAGKTSLIRRLRSQAFDKRDEEETTHGIRISLLRTPFAVAGEVEEATLEMSPRTSGISVGRRFMHATHQFFLSRSQGCIRCCFKWPHRTRRRRRRVLAGRLSPAWEGYLPVMIVRNRAQGILQQPRRGGITVRSSIDRCLCCDRCCNRSGCGWRTVRQAYYQRRRGCPRCASALPRKLVPDRKELSARDEMMQKAGKSWIPFPVFCVLCASHGESDSEGAEEQLATWLHDLGVALNYREDRRAQRHHGPRPLCGLQEGYTRYLRPLDWQRRVASSARLTWRSCSGNVR